MQLTKIFTVFVYRGTLRLQRGRLVFQPATESLQQPKSFGLGVRLEMRWVTVLLGCLLIASPAIAQVGLDTTTEVGVDEHLGEIVPLELEFLDEDGVPTKLGDLIDKPTILSLVYFRCPSICTPLLSGLADVVDRIDLEPGEDYQILTISFDVRETPDLAKRKQANFLKAVQREISPEAWRFMSGDSASVAAVTDAVGFRYIPQGKDFMHPGVIMVLSPGGKISRYLYGITFLPFDVKLALMEASEGKVSPTIRRVLLYCFSYDPEGQTYVFNLLKVVGTLITVMAVGFVAYLLISSKRSRKAS